MSYRTCRPRLLAIAIAMLLTACGTVAPHYSIGGSFTLIDSSASSSTLRFSPFALVGGGCTGTGGYSDIAVGTSVVLKDGEGKTLAVGKLGPGKSNDSPAFPPTWRCVFAFSLDDVAEVPFYAIDVSRRGAITYSLADMKAKGWTVDLTLGK